MDYSVLPIEIQTVNQHLVDHFGIDTESGQPIWRVCWSNDQFEMRKDNVTEQGIQLLYAQVMHMKKYSWIKNKWILERLVLIPEIHSDELPATKKSYECMYAFEHARTGETIVPTFQACKFIVDTVYAAMGKSSLSKYIDEDAANPIEARRARIDKLENELFGDETGLKGKTISGEAIIVPSTYGDDK